MKKLLKNYKAKWAHIKDFFSSPSYRRTLAIAGIIFLLLAIPVTVIFLGKQTNLFQHAATVCSTTYKGACVPKSICTPLNGFTHCYYMGFGCGVGLYCGTNITPTPTPLPSCSSKGGSCSPYDYCGNGKVAINAACPAFQGQSQTCCVGGTPMYTCASQTTVKGSNGTFAYCPNKYVQTYCSGSYSTNNGILDAINHLCFAYNACAAKSGSCSPTDYCGNNKVAINAACPAFQGQSQTCCVGGTPMYSCAGSNAVKGSNGTYTNCNLGEVCKGGPISTVNGISYAKSQLCIKPDTTSSGTSYACISLNPGSSMPNNKYSYWITGDLQRQYSYCAVWQYCNSNVAYSGKTASSVSQICQNITNCHCIDGKNFVCNTGSNGKYDVARSCERDHPYCITGSTQQAIGDGSYWPCSKTKTPTCTDPNTLKSVAQNAECSTGYICVGTSCNATCNNRNCNSGSTCNTSTGKCVVNSGDGTPPPSGGGTPPPGCTGSGCGGGNNPPGGGTGSTGGGTGGTGSGGGNNNGSCQDGSATIAQGHECSNKSICESGSCTAGCAAPGRVCDRSGDMCGSKGGACVACVSGNSTSFTVSLKLQGIGTGSFENNDPAHPVRDGAYVRVTNEKNTAVYSSSKTQFTYSSSTGLFAAPKVNLGTALSCGHTYTITVKLPGYVKVSQVFAYAGSNVITLTPIPGDFVSNSNTVQQTPDGRIIGDDVINILDYHVIASCHNVDPSTTLSFANNTSTINIKCSDVMNLFDYKDGGTQGDEWSFNYNLWTRGFFQANGY